MAGRAGAASGGSSRRDTRGAAPQRPGAQQCRSCTAGGRGVARRARARQRMRRSPKRPLVTSDGRRRSGWAGAGRKERAGVPTARRVSCCPCAWTCGRAAAGCAGGLPRGGSASAAAPPNPQAVVAGNRTRGGEAARKCRVHAVLSASAARGLPA